MRFRWVLPRVTVSSPEFRPLLERFRASLPGLTPGRLQVLLSRGLETPEKAAAFLRPYDTFTASDFLDPRLLPDFRKAADRVLRAIARSETVLIYGDYDADGITSIAILGRFFRQYAPGLRVLYRQPSRFGEGYGFGEEGVRFAVEHGATLIITVDCGVTSFEAVRRAREAGIDTVILDHHEPKETLPEAVAVVDPKRKDADLPFRDWAAAGVAFAFVLGLALERPDLFPGFKMAPYLELAAVGTVVDLAPLTGENRLIVRAGFKAMDSLVRGRRGCNKGLRRLRSLNRIDDRPPTGRDMSFIIGPRLNAASRMEEAVWATELLLEDDDTRVDELARKLEELNSGRRRRQREVLERLLAEIGAADDLRDRRLIVHGSPDLDDGVRGIIASQVSQTLRRPALLFTLDRETGVASGSGRSYGEFDLHGFLSGFETFRSRGGGHRYAVGVRIPLSDYPSFRGELLEAADRLITAEAIAPVLRIDAEVGAEELTEAFADFLGLFEPFGIANPPPLVLLRSARILSVQPFEWGGADAARSSLRFEVLSADEAFRRVLTLWDPAAFFGPGFDPRACLHRRADFVLRVSKSDRNGRTFLNLDIEDMALL